jgi:hypothetical protein
LTNQAQLQLLLFSLGDGFWHFISSPFPTGVLLQQHRQIARIKLEQP